MMAFNVRSGSIMDAVLVVDDDAKFLSELQSSLSARDIRIHTAVDAASASSLLEQNEYCGIVLDLVLANGSGVDLVQRIAERHRGVPVVLITAKVPTYVRQMLQPEQVKLVFSERADARLVSSIVLGLCGIAA